jgi:hypothetical protein
MARPPKLNLATIKTVRTEAAPASIAPEVQPGRTETRRGQTLRLTVAAWKQLKRLAIDEEKTSHDLLIEALNDLFRSRRLPPTA